MGGFDRFPSVPDSAPGSHRNGRSLPPVERVRARVRREAGPEVAAALPRGYQRLGPVLVLRLPERLRPEYSRIGRAWVEEFGVRSVLCEEGPVGGEWRVPRRERIVGPSTDAEVTEFGIRYRFDPERIMFARGNRIERWRAGALTSPGETVVDLFAGIGYFALPAAVRGRASRVVAVEENPLAVHYLNENVRANHVESIVEVHSGDNRRVALPEKGADRVFLGYLPNAVPWIDVAVPLVRDSGGWLHVHRVVDRREGVAAAEAEVHRAVSRLGRVVAGVRSRPVKSYGPGRTHAVVDVRLGPSERPGSD